MGKQHWLTPADGTLDEFDPSRVTPLVSRGIELLQFLSITSICNSPTSVVSTISAHLNGLIRRSLLEAEATEDNSVFLSASEEECVYSLVFLAARATQPIDHEIRESIRRLIEFMDSSGRYIWIDTLGLRITLELAEERHGPGMMELYANLNHHGSLIRQSVMYLSWMARNRLDPKLAAERILFNIGASHGLADCGLAILWAASRNMTEFRSCIENSMPDFAYGDTYGYNLEPDWPEQREEDLRTALTDLRDTSSQLSKYVRNPSDLWLVERRVVGSILSIARGASVQVGSSF